MTTTVTLHIGDVRDIQATLPDNFADLLVTSPAFLALRSYLPADHPDKHRELGSEPTPAAFLDSLYGLTAEWGRLVPEWGSICVELGDTMSGSGGAGGDYNPDGLRDGQQKFRQATRGTQPCQRCDSSGTIEGPDPGWYELDCPDCHGTGKRPRAGTTYDADITYGDRRSGYAGTGGRWGQRIVNGGPGWPLAKSMCLIPHLYTIGLAYGHNPLTGQAHPAGQWRIRNVITWARPNPPVGSLGKRNPEKRTGDQKFRPACSYITVACRGTGRYFDLDAVRTPGNAFDRAGQHRGGLKAATTPDGGGYSHVPGSTEMTNIGNGAPPLDWHQELDGDWLWRFTKPHNPPQPRRRTIIHRNDPRRPLLTYITVACRGTGRYFDLDAVRGDYNPTVGGSAMCSGTPRGAHGIVPNPAGAPPLDWHQELDGDWLWKLATAPYPGAHYATYPLTLPRRLILAMCPARVCTVCGWPSERITAQTVEYAATRAAVTTDGVSYSGREQPTHKGEGLGFGGGASSRISNGLVSAAPTTLGWSDCGHDPATNPGLDILGGTNWRPGCVLDPFAGSGTSAVAAALESRDCVLIDLDARNVELVDRRLREALHVTSYTVDGNTHTWTVDAPLPEQRAQTVGQGSLFDWLEAM